MAREYLKRIRKIMVVIFVRMAPVIGTFFK